MFFPRFVSRLENLLAEDKSVLITFVAQGLGELRRATIEDCDLALALVLNLRENLVPIRSTRIRARLQSSDQVTFLLQITKTKKRNFVNINSTRQLLAFNPNSFTHLLVEQIQSQLQTDRFHVVLLQCRSYVHVHVEESLHCTTQLCLFDLEL